MLSGCQKKEMYRDLPHGENGQFVKGSRRPIIRRN